MTKIVTGKPVAHNLTSFFAAVRAYILISGLCPKEEGSTWREKRG